MRILKHRDHREPRTQRIGRWSITCRSGAVEFRRKPDPACPECFGDGGWYAGSPSDPETPTEVACPCADGRRFRLRYRPRRKSDTTPIRWYADEPPF